jgi:dolichol-phosphate mannosyltransferase
MANEADTVTPFLEQVLAQLASDDAVLCVFDPSSRDETRARAEAMVRRDPRVRVVFDPESRSPVDAYVRGYREALADGYEWILEMDAGMSHCPEEIPRFLAAMARGVEFAAGSRFMAGGHYEGGWFHKWMLSWGGTVLANALLRTPFTDLTSGFKCHTRGALEMIVARGVRSRAHSFQIEVRWRLRDRRWEEVPISYHGASHRIGVRILLDCLRNLWTLRQERRGP